jgi:hypothetical protein
MRRNGQIGRQRTAPRARGTLGFRRTVETSQCLARRSSRARIVAGRKPDSKRAGQDLSGAALAQRLRHDRRQIQPELRSGRILARRAPAGGLDREHGPPRHRRQPRAAVAPATRMQAGWQPPCQGVWSMPISQKRAALSITGSATASAPRSPEIHSPGIRSPRMLSLRMLSPKSTRRRFARRRHIPHALTRHAHRVRMVHPCISCSWHPRRHDASHG